MSPSAVEKLAKLAKLDDDAKQDYRTRTREAYEEKRAGGRLLSATRTLSSLDEQAGVEVCFRFAIYDNVYTYLTTYSMSNIALLTCLAILSSIYSHSILTT